MTSLTSDRRTAKRKGTTAVAVAGGSLLVLVAGAPLLGALGLVSAGFLTYDWFTFRAKRGMRF